MAFSEYPLWAVLAGSFLLFTVAIEFGHQLGLQANGGRNEQISTLQGAVLGLLALMIGFTFGMSLSRHEARREAVLHEANAIGGAALIARLLPPPQNTEALKLLNAYVNIRLDLKAQSMTPEMLRVAMQQANVIQEKLWQFAMALAATDKGVVPTGLFIQSLTGVFDDQAKRVEAVRSHVPDIVLVGLYGIAVVALGLLGYESGANRRQSRLPPYLMGGVIALVLLLIHDLDRPGSGFIHISQLPMQEAADSLSNYLK